MTPFIQTLYKDGQRTVIIDGSSSEPKRTTGMYGDVVQLSRAREEESGYNWQSGDKIRKVIAKNIVIQDSCDLNCLEWFIQKGIKINIIKSDISTDAVDDLVERFQRLNLKKIKVAEGSKLSVPQLCGSMREMERWYFMINQIHQLGFKTNLDK